MHAASHRPIFNGYAYAYVTPRPINLLCTNTQCLSSWINKEVYLHEAQPQGSGATLGPSPSLSPWNTSILSPRLSCSVTLCIFCTLRLRSFVFLRKSVGRGCCLDVVSASGIRGSPYQGNVVSKLTVREACSTTQIKAMMTNLENMLNGSPRNRFSTKDVLVSFLDQPFA